MGVPTLGCGCPVCTSTNPYDRRLRPSVMVRWNEPSSDPGAPAARDCIVVIDTGPDFREQALRNRIDHIDAVFYTHSHADHILGLDDLRPLSYIAYREGAPIPLYAPAETRQTLERIFDYTFSPQATYPNRARVELKTLAPITQIHEATFQAIPLMHGNLEIVGYRFGNAAYLTDVSEIPEQSFSMLEGLEHVVLSALRHKPHPNHATVEKALGWARRIGARHTWLTHIAHELGHDQTNSSLPSGVALAYDGLAVPVTL
jgi:phosphoribosyl 1,2-cyclic phosphate phosphodiesterase